MTVPRLLLPALMTFLAGLLLGLQLARQGTTTAPDQLPADLQAWEAATVEALDLSPEQAQDLRLLLFHYGRQRESLLAARFATLDPEWQSLDQRFQALFKTRILSPAQREAAADLRRPKPLAAGLPPR